MTLNELDAFLNSFLKKEDFPGDPSLNGIQIQNSAPDKTQITKVAFAVDACQETHGLYGDAVLEQHLDIVNQVSLLARCLLSFKLGTFLKSALQVPGYESHHKEREEDNTRREDVGLLLRQTSAANSVCHSLNPSEQIAARGKQHAEEQDNHRAHAP